MGIFDPIEGAPPKLHVEAWSFSRLKDYGTCPHRVYLKAIEKVKEEESPALINGTRKHKLLEDYVKGDIARWTMIESEINFEKDDFKKLRTAYNAGKVMVEENWGFNRQWEAVDWFAKDIWNRTKLDALHFIDDTYAIAIDYKTGKYAGNQVTHSDQLMSYIVASFMRFPNLELVAAEAWYIDHNKKMKLPPADRETMKSYKTKLEDRVRRLNQDTTFKPKPRKWVCKWCGVKHACQYAETE